MLWRIGILVHKDISPAFICEEIAAGSSWFERIF